MLKEGLTDPMMNDVANFLPLDKLFDTRPNLIGGELAHMQLVNIFKGETLLI